MLTHPKMLVIIVCLLAQGHLLAPGPLNFERFVLGILGVVLAVLGVYRVNEVMDFKGRGPISRVGHMATAALLISIGASIGVCLALIYAWWILVLLIIGACGMLAYNMTRARVIHNRAFYGFIWGSFPCYASWALQGLKPLPSPSIIVLGAFWGVMAVQTLWLWGARGCRLQPFCTRVGSDYRRKCHSPTIRCIDRMNMPKTVRDHAKMLINLQVLLIIILTVALGVFRYGR